MAKIDQMEVHICGKCGVESWMLIKYLDDKRENKDTFYCPNGHPRAYTKSVSATLREKLAAAERSLAQKTEDLDKLKAGKCPFCWRTLHDLVGHINRRHA